jgi:hypothetical protein
MSGKALSYLFLLVASLAIGVGIGEVFFNLFKSVAPPAALSQFNVSGAHFMHLLYGAGVGLAMFVWAMIAIGMNKLASIGKKSEAKD